MTSEFTLDPTKKFFEENKYFGLDPSNVVMFEQRMIHCLFSYSTDAGYIKLIVEI